MPVAPLLLAACAAIWLTTSPALADRSRVATQAEVVEAGDCELELATARQRERREPRRRTQSIELDCGIGWDTEALLALARQRQGSERETDWGVELKTAIWPRRGSAVGWSLIASARREKSSNARSRWAEAGLAVQAAMQPANHLRLEARLGTLRDRIERRDRTAWELAVENAFAPRWELRVQLGGQDQQRPEWQLALRWVVWPEHALLTMSYGGSSTTGRPRQTAIALTWEF